MAASQTPCIMEQGHIMYDRFISFYVSSLSSLLVIMQFHDIVDCRLAVRYCTRSALYSSTPFPLITSTRFS